MRDFATNLRPTPARLSCALVVSLLCLGGLCTVSSVADEQPSTAEASADLASLEQQLREAETAFAASFAAGDMEAFASFLDEHAVFMGRSNPLRGKQAIVERWTRMRGTDEAPFSWRPERVAVEADGQLGMSTGPVSSPEGTWLSSFVSTWKRTDDGWRVVLDVGPRCPPPAAPSEG